MKKFIKTIILVAITTLTSCVQEEHEKKLTLVVDMNAEENFESVGVRGDFLPNQWRETVLMTDENKGWKLVNEKNNSIGVSG